VTEDSTLGLRITADSPGQASSPETQLVARIFLVAVGALLLGYMFLGRGFAHIGIGPIYIGDWILLLGIATAAFVIIRAGVRAPMTWTIALLLAFVALGALRTLPYIDTYGLNALRDGTLWGYAGFALIVYLLADRWLLLRAFRLYGWVVPIFALWLPISWNLFASASTGIVPDTPGSFIPLVFFKGGDMAVHTVGAIAFLVIGASGIRSARTFVWRTLIGLPLLWTIFVAGTSNRGALVTACVGIVVVAIMAWRSRNWLPLLAATAVFVIAVVFEAALTSRGEVAITPSVEPTTIASGSATSPASIQPFSAPAASPSDRDGAANASIALPDNVNRLSVANPSFELGPLNSGSIKGWAASGLGSHNIVSGGAYRGTRFAYVQNVGKPYEESITSSRFPFKDGPDVAVSVWAKAINGRPILEIYVNWYDRSGTLIASTLLNTLGTDGVGSWQMLTGASQAPANTAQADIKLYEASGDAAIGIDDVTIKSGDFPNEIRIGRPATLQQMIENLLSIFGSSSDSGLEGSKQFRLAWWGNIVDYTVFGNYFWTGKGFGVNLADADGFQSTADHSLRSPHNSEMTVLARMGVPGLILWLLVLGAFGIGLLRAAAAHRRNGDAMLAAISAFIFVYWFAMLVDTSFDPYLEGPQGGIWFWVIFGTGLVVMRLAPSPRVAE
jgi:hypothetical protein